ncbi:serine protease HTRA1-like isoform X2 [Oppia nitens]|uniref:serine protease HTRA1-like isoform X2 n=1 Tax=Oppia nitens TaxID=1686743 RepID=UPI0023D9D3E1|nr:serine protease HTRA1-like isoform X2 [Oppia nitens]
MYRFAHKIQFKNIIKWSLSITGTYVLGKKYTNYWTHQWSTTTSQRSIMNGLKTARMDASVDQIEGLYESVRSWVVRVSVPKFSESDDEMCSSTGFLVDGDMGFILTNYHCILDTNTVAIVFESQIPESQVVVGKESSEEAVDTFKGRVVYVDPQQDLALICLQHYIEAVLPELELSEMDAEVGDDVISVGNPMISNTLQSGIVCSGSLKGDLSNSILLNNDTYINMNKIFMCHSSTGWPGASGSPVINLDGKVVGIHFALLLTKNCLATKRTDIFAFIERAKQYMNSTYIEMQNERQQRNQRANTLGIILQEFAVKGYAYNVSVNVRNLLQINDTITAVNGTQLTNIKQLTDALDTITGDQTIRLTIRRQSRLESGKHRMDELDVNLIPETPNNRFYF